MKNKKNYLVLLCLWSIMALTSMSCSDSSSESEPIYKNWLDPYEFFKERGDMNCWSFKNMRISDLDDLIYTTWNRDSVVSPTGEKSRIKNFTIEINKDNTYIEHLPKGKVVHNIRKMEIKDTSLLLTLDNDSVVRYDSIIWNVDKCSLVSRGKNGELYKDYRKKWSKTKDVHSWCALWFITYN